MDITVAQPIFNGHQTLAAPIFSILIRHQNIGCADEAQPIFDISYLVKVENIKIENIIFSILSK